MFEESRRTTIVNAEYTITSGRDANTHVVRIKIKETKRLRDANGHGTRFEEMRVRWEGKAIDIKGCCLIEGQLVWENLRPTGRPTTTPRARHSGVFTKPQIG